MASDFGKHPSERLQSLFSQRPFQIQDPEKAKVIFLSLDANFQIDIESNNQYFEETLDYLRNGVKYWKTKGYHTPMLSDVYKGDGKKFHERFRKLGLSPNYAQDICFMELLNVCTYGQSTKNRNEYRKLLESEENRLHLNRLTRLANDKSRQIYICGAKVLQYIQELNLFDVDSKNVFKGIHFSAQNITDENLCILGTAIKLFIDTGTYIPKDCIKKNLPLKVSSIITDKKSSKRDFTKYIFNGKQYGKGKLVLAIVKSYVKYNPAISYSELKEKFPDELQYDRIMKQRYGVIQLANFVSQHNWETRFFLKPQDRINLSSADEEIVVSKEWGKGNIDKFLKNADELGFKIDIASCDRY